jgi:hypothetical protein
MHRSVSILLVIALFGATFVAARLPSKPFNNGGYVRLHSSDLGARHFHLAS